MSDLDLKAEDVLEDNYADDMEPDDVNFDSDPGIHVSC